MYLLQGIIENSERVKVTSIFNLDGDNYNHLLGDNPIIVDEIAEPTETKRGMSNVLFVNPQTKEQWYEFETRPLTIDEQLEEQTEKIDLLLQMQMSMQGVI